MYRVLLTVKCSKFSLGSFGAFPIFDDLVHVYRKRLIVERNRAKCGLWGKFLVCIKYFSLLSVQGQFGVIRYISIF